MRLSDEIAEAAAKKKQKRRRRNNNQTPPLPQSPTLFLPGTEGKIAVMEDRVDHWYQPHHPLDGRETRRNAT